MNLTNNCSYGHMVDKFSGFETGDFFEIKSYYLGAILLHSIYNFQFA
jgi:hypothetical protein